MTISCCKLKAKLSEFSDEKSLSNLIHQTLNNQRSSPGRILNQLSTFYEDEEMTLGLDYLREKVSSDSCCSQEHNLVLKILSDMEITVVEYQLSEDNQQQKVKEKEAAHYSKGDVVPLFRGCIYDLLVKQGGSIVVAKEKDKDDVKYNFYKQTGELLSVTATKNHYSRLQFAAKILGKFPDKKSLVSLKKLLVHEAHFVRWEAAQAFALIAEQHEIREMLEMLSKDVHPHIQNAAAKSLARIKEI